MRSRALGLAIALALVGAGCGGSGRPAAKPAAAPTTADATPTTADASAVRAAVAAWHAGSQAMFARVAQSADVAALWSRLDDEQLAALADPAAAAAQFRTDGLLEGQRLVGPSPVIDEHGDAGRGATTSRVVLGGRVVPLAAAAHEVHVYFVNGVLNTSQAAGEAAYQLGLALGVNPRLYYNRSALEPRDYEVDVCERAIERIAAKGLPSEHLDPQHWWTRLGAKVADGTATLVEGAAYAACRAADGAAAMEASTFGHAADLAANSWQAVAQRIANRDIDSASVNDAVVRDAEADIAAGNAVVLVGHSQGTLFVRNALARIQRWWDAEHGSGCDGAGSGGLSATRAAPVGALYISPAFGARNDATRSYVRETERQSGAQRYVELAGDALGTGIDHAGIAIAPMTPTASPGPDQQGSAVHVHYLTTYLQEGTESQRQIVDRFNELRDYVAAKAALSPAPGCASSSTTTSGSGGSANPAGTWVVWRGVNATGVGVNITTLATFEKREPASNYDGGGLDPNYILVKARMLPGDFPSQDAATAALCSKMTDVRLWPLGTGLHGVWTDHKAYPLNVPCDVWQHDHGR